MERSSPFAVMIWTTTIQCILFILISPISLYRGITAPMTMLGGIVILTIFTWVIPYFLILKGIEAIGASRASLISSLEIIFTLALAFLLLNERLSPMQAIGAALVIGSVFVLPRGSKEALPPQALS
jgi:drug/metabolite transporter (DMT)-like permease